jgi:hypothetical protein
MSKRTMSEAGITDNLVPKEDPRDWVSATAVQNYILSDHLVDWLKLYCDEQQGETAPMLRYLFDQGHKFEEKLVDKIKARFPVVHITSMYRKYICVRTTNEMKKGTPIIWSAPLGSDTLKTFGLADILIRSDYINKLVPNSIPVEMETLGCSISPNFHYIVIDIKFSTLPLRADGTSILNSGRYSAYKSQLWIYTQLIGEIQGYTPTIAFIMGRGYFYEKCGQKHSGSSAFDKLGKVDFTDGDIARITHEAIEWLRSLRKTGGGWTMISHPELFPNMKADSGQFYTQKKKIAGSIGEITQLWYCGVTQRKLALSKGISSWKDPRFTAEIVGLKNKCAVIFDQMLETNRGDDLYLPTKLSNTHKLCRKLNREFFVDFETLSGVFDDFSTLPVSRSISMIFMISVVEIRGTEEERVEKTFCVNSATLEEELKIMREFKAYVGEESELYHWSDAEPVQWNCAMRRHLNTGDLSLEDRWTDLLHIFKSEPITVKGCFSYSLKEVSNTLASFGIVPANLWSSDTLNGEDAMLLAYQELNKGETIETSKILQDIGLYNRCDCWAVYHLLEFIRKHLIQ